MKSNELMLGDWVYALSSRGEEFTATTVKNIYDADEDEPCGTIMEKYGRIVGSSEFKPIPLTQEILEKSGFDEEPFDKWEDSMWVSKNDRVLISKRTRYKEWYIHIDCEYFSPVWSMECDYVHELQHILRFCGLNELADNLKIE